MLLFDTSKTASVISRLESQMLRSSPPQDLSQSVLLAEMRSRLVLEKRFNRYVYISRSFFYTACFALPLCVLLCLLGRFLGHLSNSVFYWWAALNFVFILSFVYFYRALTRHFDSASEFIVSSYPFPPTN
jgi:hypothetical protein